MQAKLVEGSSIGGNPKARRNFEINKIFKNEKGEHAFPNNKVTTTKYNCFNFLPKNLFIQFSKVANAYFLFLVFLQLIPGMAASDTGAIFTLLPLLFVVGISMVKDLVEDRNRGKQDTAENNDECFAALLGKK